MRIRTKVLIGLTAAALVSGCASSGGSGKVTNADGTASDMTGGDFLVCLLSGGLACGGTSANSKESSAATTTSNTTSATSSGVSSWQPPATFSSWSELEAERTTEAPALSTGFSWSGRPIQSTWIDRTNEYLEDFRYGANGDLLSVGLIGNSDGRGASLAPLGHAGIEFLLSWTSYQDPQSPFTSLATTNVGAIANAFDLGWDYQSFGVWTNLGFGTVDVVTFGAPTPASSVPATGSAAFTGKLAGFYLSSTDIGYTAVADLSVQANFTSRSLSVNSSGTTLTRNFTTGTPAPNLNVSGTLSYAAGSGTFRGNLTNAGGTMSGESQGRFYGPAAQELGGVFTLKSATTMETFAGAYGAKR